MLCILVIFYFYNNCWVFWSTFNIKWTSKILCPRSSVCIKCAFHKMFPIFLFCCENEIWAEIWVTLTHFYYYLLLYTVHIVLFFFLLYLNVMHYDFSIYVIVRLLVLRTERRETRRSYEFRLRSYTSMCCCSFLLTGVWVPIPFCVRLPYYNITQ